MSTWYPTPTGPVGTWRPLAGPARALRVLLVLVILALGLAIVAAVVRWRVYDQADASLSSLDGADAFLGFTTLLVGGLTLAVAVLTIVWQWRLAKNHDLLCPPDTTFGPGWAIGAWFIPLANLVLPFLQFRELWQGSEPGLARCSPAWRQVRVAPLLWAWWVPFVASYVVEWATTFRIAFGTEALDADATDTAGTVATNLLRILAAVGFVVVVRRLTERQEHAMAVGSAAAEAPAAGGAWTRPPLAPPPDLAPGWKADPTGRATYRYWDGIRWTDHAAMGGRAFTSPV